MATVEDLAQAIARYEGFYRPGTLAQRNNNPGNLRSWGSYPVVNGFVRFPDEETGWTALRGQVAKNIDRGLSLEEFFGGKAGVYPGYAPAADNNRPLTYARTVANWLGISSDAPLADALGGGVDSIPSREQGGDYASILPAAAGSTTAAGVALAIGAVSLGWLLLTPRG
jgi:hypothetical protein